jgi:hypothetical protein
MIVYGDPHFSCAAVTMLNLLDSRIAEVDPDSLDQLRTLLIQAGQLEQGCMDYLSTLDGRASAEVISNLQRVTDLAAEAFYTRFARREISDPAELLATMRKALGRVTGFPDVCLVVKVPEGFQSYALYPEAYIVSARRWIRKHQAAAPKRATVIGIRSIGTTLSAVIAVALRSMGWQTERCSVRPTGNPFHRTTSLDHHLNHRSWVIIADEGPGLSGSSMASAATAVVEAGGDAQRLSFFPGHAGEPGAKATPEVRCWWETIPRFVTSQRSLRWDGNSLRQCLADKSMNGPAQFEDMSDGAWRAKVYPDESCWPPSTRPFGSIKVRCSDSNGRSVIWNFVGLGPWIDHQADGSSQALTQSLDRAKQGWSPVPLGTSHGYLALPWIPGAPLRPSDARDPKIIENIGRYVVQVGRPPMHSDEHFAATERLAQMLYWNTKEAIGNMAAEHTRKFFAQAQSLRDCPCYGDGRMAPHKWLRTGDGRIWKTDSFGHYADHTVIGKQPLLWDVAGTLIEWKLDARSAARLVAIIEQAGVMVDEEVLKFYCLAYAAFKLGQMMLCEETESEPGEKARIAGARAEYQHALSSFLNEPASVEG